MGLHFLFNLTNPLVNMVMVIVVKPCFHLQTVVAEGGYDEVTAQKKWSEIGRTVSDREGWSLY